jgi:hypothetical protein
VQRDEKARVQPKVKICGIGVKFVKYEKVPRRRSKVNV